VKLTLHPVFSAPRARDGVPATGGAVPPHGGGTGTTAHGAGLIPRYEREERRGIRDACAQNAFLLFLEKEEKLQKKKEAPEGAFYKAAPSGLPS
jgi:hypothetical protein